MSFPRDKTESQPDLSIVIPARNEAGSIGDAVTGARRVCEEIGMRFEVLVIDAGSSDGTSENAEAAGARVITQQRPGYGGAIIEGILASAGEWVLTMDADLSHPPQFIERLWSAREGRDLVIASRYVPGGYAKMPIFRYVLSWVLNRLFAFVLSVPVLDMSSGFRLYRRASLMKIVLEGTNFNVLQNILVRLYSAGFVVEEVPFYYQPRKAGASNARLIPFGVSYLKTLYKLWKLRHSPDSADYDFHAFYSRHPLQRYWQRKRYRHIINLLGEGGRILDVGAGSSVFAAQYPNVTAIDSHEAKVRFLSRFNPRALLGNAFALPFPDASFPVVVCSSVIEHTEGARVLAECARVLAPGGALIVGTPDFSAPQWRFFERIYRSLPPMRSTTAYINPYTRERLKNELEEAGLVPVEERAILGAEIIIKAVKAPDSL